MTPARSEHLARRPRPASEAPPPLERILHVSDGSPGSAAAFAHALGVGIRSGAFLQLLQVQPPGPAGPDWGALPRVTQAIRRWEGPGSAGSQLGVCRSIVLDRDPARAIVRHLQVERADLLVMATAAVGPFERWLRGSLAERVLRATDVSTLLVPPGARGFVRPADGVLTLRRLLLDGSGGPRATEAAGRAALTLGLALGLERADCTVISGPAGPPAALGPLRRPGWEVSHLALPGGMTEEQLLGEARGGAHDLLVLPIEAGRRGLGDLLRGGPAARVGATAPCPVLVVPG